MDITSTFIGLAMLALFVAPLWVMRYKRIKLERSYETSFLDLVKQEGGTITVHEMVGNVILGMDEINNKVYFLSNLKGGVQTQVVDLSLYAKSDYIKITENAQSGDTVSVKIEFVSKNKENQNVVLELYDVKFKPQMSGEFLFSKSWTEKINHQMKKYSLS